MEAGKARSAIAWNLCVYDAAVLVATLALLLSGRLNWLGWGVALFYAFFAAGFAFFLKPTQKPLPA